MLFLAVAIILILQIIWFITDPRPIKDRLLRYYGKRTIFLLTLEAGVLIPQIISHLYFPLNLGPTNRVVSDFGLIILLTGGWLATWAKVVMGKYWGPPGEFESKRQNRLITTGPFSFSRNPIYLGLFSVSLGFSLALESILFPLTLLVLFYFNQTAKIEEKISEKHFGQKFLDYKNKTPRFIWKL